MIGRYFLLFLGLISLVWIGYVGSDLIDKKNQLSPSHIFGKEDGRVLVINRLEECSHEDLQFSLQPETAKLYDAIHPHLTNVKSLIFSELKNKLLIERTDDWNEEKIKSLFKNANLSVKFTSRNEFNVGKFQGKYNFSILSLVKKGTLAPSFGNDEWLSFDQKSSASIITFTNNTFSIADVYVNDKNQIEYVSKIMNSNLGKQIDDELLFSQVLPSAISNYHFYEKNFYCNIDNKFSKRPLFNWLESGFVEFNYNGHAVIISDYISGQDPILILNDWNDGKIISSNEAEGLYKNIRLTEKFPEVISLGFYIKRMGDFVVASTSQSVCEQVIADYELGNTVALKQGEEFYRELPKKVSERFISTNLIYSSTIYRNKLLQTKLKPKTLRPNTQNEILDGDGSENSKTISLLTGGTVKSFKVFAGKGNVVSLTMDGQLTFFSGGKISWKKKIGKNPIGEIQLIDLNGNGEEQILCTLEHQIHLLDKQGNELNGFPIPVEAKATNEVTCYKWNGASYFVLANDKQQLLFYDSKGQRVNNFKTGLSSIKQKIDVWVSNSILLASAKDDSHCILYNINDKKEHRHFDIDKESFSVKKANELFQFSMKNNQLMSIDQKGNRKNGSSYNSGKILSIVNDKSGQTIVVRTNNELHFLSNQGNELKSFHLPFSELDYVSTFTSPSGASFFSIIDGLENNVFVYTMNGELLSKEPLTGSQQVILTWENNKEMIISTVVDGYIVQYVGGVK